MHCVVASALIFFYSEHLHASSTHDLLSGFALQVFIFILLRLSRGVSCVVARISALQIVLVTWLTTSVC